MLKLCLDWKVCPRINLVHQRLHAGLADSSINSKNAALRFVVVYHFQAKLKSTSVPGSAHPLEFLM